MYVLKICEGAFSSHVITWGVFTTPICHGTIIDICLIGCAAKDGVIYVSHCGLFMIRISIRVS